MKRPRSEPLSDRIYRFRGLLLILSAPLLLFTLLILLRPDSNAPTRSSNANANRKVSPSRKSVSYAVIFDAGSSGSRVHVFCFDHHLDLLPIGDELELFKQMKPGLSAYASNPHEAAESLNMLLKEAEKVVPSALHAKTPVKVGATAGLRALEGDASDRILQAVRDFLKDKSSLKFRPEWVTVLDGTQEGAYQWVTINYLLGRLGKSYADTVGVVDLGGGSVQMAYAISEKDAAKAPQPAVGDDSYVKELFLKGVKYYLYVHSYLHYGLLAARVEILNAVEGPEHPCVLKGYHGSYNYGGMKYKTSGLSSGSSFKECRKAAVKALKVNESTCTHMKCTFGGIWNGGGGDGQKNLFVASFFFDRAVEAGFVDAKQPIAKVKPSDFEKAAKRVCGLSLEEAKHAYSDVDEGNLPFLCMDLSYQYSLLVDGFAIKPHQKITLVKKVKYGDDLVEAAWPLGSAIEAVSSSS